MAPGKKTAKSAAGPNAEDRRVAAYEKQFLALEGQVFKLEAENSRLRARIKILEEAKPGAAAMTMTDVELEAAIVPLIEQMGYVKKKR